MRVFVVGGTDFIGPLVVQQLVASGQAVAVFHRGISEPERLPDVPHFHGERSDGETLTAAVHKECYNFNIRVPPPKTCYAV